MNGWTDGQTDGRTDGWPMNWLTAGRQMDGTVNSRTNGGWTDGLDESKNTSILTKPEMTPMSATFIKIQHMDWVPNLFYNHLLFEQAFQLPPFGIGKHLIMILAIFLLCVLHFIRFAFVRSYLELKSSQTKNNGTIGKTLKKSNCHFFNKLSSFSRLEMTSIWKW